MRSNGNTIYGRTDPLDAARDGTAPERAAIVALLERPVITDPQFRAAVAAIHAGDVAALTRLLNERPQLLHERAVEPPCYHEVQRHQYFLDPKLFWFIAYNPTLAERMPENGTAAAPQRDRRFVLRTLPSP